VQDELQPRQEKHAKEQSMKRFHVHVAVPDLQLGIRFYSTMFGSQPSVVKPDYAKWMLEDPRVNFAISQRGGAAGVNHLGFQVDSDAELGEIHARLQAADSGVLEERGVACCYAKSDKYWVTDPAGVAWESFRSLGTVPLYAGAEAKEGAGACCTPAAGAQTKSACCA
jgi:catechol 2,3-dioxygenase-like lactoylglutathione lyase family enzyme